MKLYHKATNRPVRRGDSVTDFRGEHATVIDWHPPHKTASSGRIEVDYTDAGNGGSYYPSVFGCEFRDNEEDAADLLVKALMALPKTDEPA